MKKCGDITQMGWPKRQARFAPAPCGTYPCQRERVHRLPWPRPADGTGAL